MAEAAYIETIRGSRFSVIPKDEVPGDTTFHDIKPTTGSNFFLNDHVLKSNQGNCLLDEVHYMTTLTQWMTVTETIDSRLFQVKVSDKEALHQIVRPTNKGLAMVRAILKTVGRFHRSNSALSYPVEFGVNVPADEENNPEYEIVIIQGAEGRYTIKRDLQFVKKVIFDKILRFPNFINYDEDLAAPRLPAGLMELEDKMSTNTSLNKLTKHYSIFDWKHQRELLKAQFDQGCQTPWSHFSWKGDIPLTGVVSKFLRDQPNILTRMGEPVCGYEERKGHLLRFMRHFFNHFQERNYSSDANEPTDDFKSDEYVICVFSEIFTKHYWCFFP